MRKLFAVTLGAVGAFAAAAPVGASGDFSCDPEWRMPGRTGCAETAMLSPGNDTRVNLLFLLRDRQGLSSATLPAIKPESDGFAYGRTFFGWYTMQRALFPEMPSDTQADGAGSRCQTLQTSSPLFVAAVAANRRVTATERALLEAARDRLGQTCGKAEPAPWPAGIASAAGKEFLAYLQGADAFYGERWDEARGTFARLANASDPWVAETSTYMLARSGLSEAQAPSFNEYGDFDGPEKVDKAALQRAQTALVGYLRQYPRGAYAGSAQGLVRRAFWLAGDVKGLSREYERLLLAVPGTNPLSARLVQEIDYKLLMKDGAQNAVDGPMLLATIDLRLMRKQDEEGTPGLSFAQLEAQQPRFAGRADLYSYLLASHAFHIGKDARRVLDLIPDDAREAGYTSLAFSRQVLRGMALAALGDRNEAGFWRELLSGADAVFQRPVVELALALHHERTGRLAELFAPCSPVQDSAIREILLAYTAGPALLRAQARDGSRSRHERDVALLALLLKELTRGLYADFLRDRQLVPAGSDTTAGLWSFPLQEKNPVGIFTEGNWSGEGYPCPALPATAGVLARNPRDAKALLCLGEFYRLNGFDDLVTTYRPREAGELGGGPEQFLGKPTYRDGIYNQIIADAGAPGGDKAYALYRAVRCYAPNGNNSCSLASVDLNVRRSWFQRLKRDYPKSAWARQLEYYW